MADHRYVEDRWRAVLVKIIQTPRHRIRLVRRAQHSAEIWGFCKGGLAFLRILGVVEAQCGEKKFQRGVDKCLATMAKHPGASLAAANIVARVMRELDGSGILVVLAERLERAAGGKSNRQ